MRASGWRCARELAENEDLRADYDAWIAWSAARAILDSVGDEARANSGQINPSVMNETARALIPLVGGPDEVRLVVWGYCLKHDISPQAASPNLATPKNGFDSHQPESDGAEPAVHSDGAASDLAPSNVSQAGLSDKKEAGSGIPWPALIFAVLCFIVTMVFVHWHTPVALHLF